jgi:hypothetical protein
MHEKMQGEGGEGKGKDQKEIEMAERGDIGCCQVLQMEMEIQAPMQMQCRMQIYCIGVLVPVPGPLGRRERRAQ